MLHHMKKDLLFHVLPAGAEAGPEKRDDICHAALTFLKLF